MSLFGHMPREAMVLLLGYDPADRLSRAMHIERLAALEAQQSRGCVRIAEPPTATKH